MTNQPHDGGLSPESHAARVERLIGVYDADGTLRGELAYWVGARLGRSHCSLCDITHGLARERSDWKSCRAGLPVPFDTFHRDDQPHEVRAAASGVVPVVVAETSDGFVVLLEPGAIEACAASPDKLVSALESAVEAAGLQW